MNPSVQPALVHQSHIRVLDEWQETIPEDLYIPPAAFEILLEHFEGPLDFLIYLIQKNGFNLLQLDIAPIANQYLSYIESMKSLNIELTADYLVMAALLADLKSRLLLPKASKIHLEKDPKPDLVERLETYLSIKQAAERLGGMSVLERDTFPAHIGKSESLDDLMQGFSATALRDAMLCVFTRPEPIIHEVKPEAVLLEERMAFIEQKLALGQVLKFEEILLARQGRMGMVVSFMAILELIRQQKLQIVQDGATASLQIQGCKP
ncbi:ScpA family protein [uncultured Acinetobacter sp.]|uniref:segregation and condensation protein A n=1 Tax=uncultured Acinetobacter sp. TaxID=165433 RepID=UPI002612D192|nr:ScpA family protein [uncultured Acinetobacter sp.]